MTIRGLGGAARAEAPRAVQKGASARELGAIADLLRRREITPQTAEDLKRAIARNGPICLYQELRQLGVRGESIAASLAFALGGPLYPRTAKTRPGDVVSTPKELRRGDGWTFMDNGTLYVLNPFDDAEIQIALRALEKTEQVSDIGVISFNQFHGEVRVSEKVSDTAAQDVGHDELLNKIVIDAARRNASDIHFEPTDNGVKVRIRVAGEMMSMQTIGLDVWAAFVNRIFFRANENAGSAMRIFDGQFIFTGIKGRTIKLRIAISPVKVPGAEDDKSHVVIRLLGNSVDHKKLDEVGIADHRFAPQLSIIRSILKRPEGLFLVTGPTGSGKTTTLAACLYEMTTEGRGRTFDTIEDPVEMHIPGVNHKQAVDPKHGMTDLTFEKFLKALLRQDPNVILVGEVRDKEVATVCMSAALTGRFVLSTLHTNSALLTIPRLTYMGVDPNLTSITVKGISAQRLTPKLCEKCKLAARWAELSNGSSPIFKHFTHLQPVYHNCALQLEGLQEAPAMEQQVFVRKPGGCDECGKTGIRDRSIVAEVLEVNRELADAINDRKSFGQLEQIAKANGFKEMWSHAAMLIGKGTLSFDDAVQIFGTRERAKARA